MSDSTSRRPAPTGAYRDKARRPGPGSVLELIRCHGSLTRSEIQELTGNSRVTVGQRVAALLEAGLIHEGEDRRSTGGRRPTSLRFNTAGGLFVMAALETTRMRIALTDLAGTVLAVDEPDLEVADGPERCLHAVRDSAFELLRACGRTQDELRGIGISLPGPVDPITLRPSEPPIMPGWDRFPVAENLRESLGVPAVVENDANAMALGEQRHRFPQAPGLVLVKVSTGIGAGIVVDGSLYQGVDGGAGDIGHIKLPEAETAVCRCGNRGCLAAIASGAAVARGLSRPGREIITGRDVADLIRTGDAMAQQAVAEAGETIGVVLANVVSLVNPAVLVLSGDLASSSLLAGVRTSLYRLTLPRATRNLQIELGEPGGHTAARGLASELVDTVFSAGSVDERLRG